MMAGSEYAGTTGAPRRLKRCHIPGYTPRRRRRRERCRVGHAHRWVRRGCHAPRFFVTLDAVYMPWHLYPAR